MWFLTSRLPEQTHSSFRALKKSQFDSDAMRAKKQRNSLQIEDAGSLRACGTADAWLVQLNPPLRRHGEAARPVRLGPPTARVVRPRLWMAQVRRKRRITQRGKQHVSVFKNEARQA